MKNHKDDCDSTQLVLERLVLDQLLERQPGSLHRRLRHKGSHPKRSAVKQPRRRDPARRPAPRRPRFEPVRLLTPSSWGTTDYMTLGLGAILIVGLFVAVGQGIAWVILPGAAAVIFAMISTQLGWRRRPRRRRLRYQQEDRALNTSTRRSLGGGHTGGIVQLPTHKDSKRRTG